ncbi:hypothetical protein BHM03_00057182 [Ensete ventricosum]|nr:hypothetical protein BHM03_00057182 [Ensete ventricosum]
MGSRTNMVSRKNTTVIKFARSRMQSHVSIDFSCTVSEIQNIGHSQRISPWEVIQAWFRKKTQRSYNLHESRAESSFDRFFVYHLENSKYCPFPTYWPMGSHTSMASQKNVRVINFA